MEEKELLLCPVEGCGMSRKIGQSIVTHISLKHKLSKEDIQKQFPDFYAKVWGFMSEQGAKHAAIKPTPIPVDDVIEEPIIDSSDVYSQVFAGFSLAEKQEALEFLENTYQQIERDRQHWGQCVQLAVLHIQLLRVSGELGTKKLKQLDEVFMENMKSIQDEYNNTMKSLGLSREQKLKAKVQITSTPSMVISAYMQQMERYSPETRQTWVREEQRVLAQTQERIKKEILEKAPLSLGERKPSGHSVSNTPEATGDGLPF